MQFIIPNELMNEKFAQHIHSQSLQRLNERGGMSPMEIYMNIERKSYNEAVVEYKKANDEMFFVNKLITYLK